MIIPYALAAIGGDAYLQMNRVLITDTPVIVQIRPGEHLPQVLSDLRQRGLFANPRQIRYLRVWARLTGQARHIHAAEYRIQPGMDALALLKLLTSNHVVKHQLTFVDGWTFAQARAAIVADPALRHTLPAKATDAEIMAAIGHGNEKPEGRFFPDTYDFPRGETDVALLRTAYQHMKKRLAKTWAGRGPKLPFDKAYDALILASIIEKETAQPDERERIAGVFVRRLRIGMKLQTDPTVIYGLGKKYHGKLTTHDLTTDTPYNTYTRKGLPPTPICLPGQASLTAAVHPAQGKALYFVSKGNGTHKFSDTLKQQDRAVRRYQLHKK